MYTVPGTTCPELRNYACPRNYGVTAARAAKNGGSIFSEKMAIGPYGFIALVHDTEGNTIGLHSMQ